MQDACYSVRYSESVLYNITDFFRVEQVIGLTTTACAMNWPLLNKLGIQIVICEEAGEVMEAQTLCTLFGSVEHAIFIGDPQQLRSVPFIMPSDQID